MRIHSMQTILSQVAAAALAFGVVVTTAHAQMEPMAPMPPPAASPGTPAPAAKSPKAPKVTARTNAQLEQEIKSLRAQVRELQRLHGMAMDQPPAAPPMKKNCMGMGCMEKDDDAMGMPPPDGTDPKPMPDAMPHM